MDIIDKTLHEIKEEIEKYLSEKGPLLELISWTYKHLMYLKREDFSTNSNRAKAKLLDYAFSTILEAHPDEPKEYRATKADLKEILSYIEGKEIFDGEHINLEEAEEGNCA